METVGILRSFHGTTASAQSFLEKPAVLPAQSASLHNLTFPQASVSGGRSVFSTRIQKRTFFPLLKASEATIAATSGDASEKISGSLEKKIVRNSTFPNGFENLILEVCDETEVAELKLKVGDFEMHLKRNIGAPKSPPHIVSPTTAPPIPSEPMAESVPVAPSVAPPVTPQKSSQVPTNPFSNVSSPSAAKLAALEASGTNGYVIVSSPTVGSFRSGRTIKGKKQPASCKEGDLIKEGQTIGYLDQFGNELPVKSDVAGEVLKILFKDGGNVPDISMMVESIMKNRSHLMTGTKIPYLTQRSWLTASEDDLGSSLQSPKKKAVGYGDPLVAVLPSFPGINT